MLHRIQKIISALPYTIVCEWTNGEIREIEMEDKIKEWATPEQSIYKVLLDKNIFIKVSLDSDSKTLFWDGLLKMHDTSGKQVTAALDLDPEVLYRMSKPLKK